MDDTMSRKRLLRVQESNDVFANESLQKEKQQRIQKKINPRFIILFGLFLILMLFIASRLIYLQVTQHDKYSQIALTQFDETRIELPNRGEIVDRNGNILLSNQEKLNFVYLAPKTDTEETRIEKAKKFVELFEVDISTMTHRDKQDAYIYYYPEEISKLNTPQELEQFSAGALTNADLYQLQLSRITPSLINNSLTQQQLQEFFILIKMRSRIDLDVILKEDVTHQEVTQLLERSLDFSGIVVRPSWDRYTTEGHHLGPILGEITTSRQGLLSDNSISMQALNYRLNDRVGRSGLEQKYESLLAGVRTEYSLTYSPSGLVNLNEINTGRKGDSLKLTIDTAYQNDIETIVSDFVLDKAYNGYHEFFNQMFVVVSDPNNGDVLASVGIIVDDDREIIYSPNGTYLNAFLAGSSIKGAVVYLALDEEVFAPGELVLDEPIKIQGTSLKSSSAVLGEVDDIRALSHSSNVYMFKTAIELGEGEYEYDKPLNLKSDTFPKVRSNFSQFGLGVETGLDVPLEERGFQSNSTLPGYLLDYVIGQYDSYTAMQLNQYVSTIANGEYRYKMRLASESYDTVSDTINYQNDVQILNAIDNPMAISRVQQGFRQCVTDGYCRALNDAQLETAAKTGSAEDFLYQDGINHETVTNTMVAYAPFDNPQIAISCIAPHYTNNERQIVPIEHGCLEVVENIINHYAQNNQLIEPEIEPTY